MMRILGIAGIGWLAVSCTQVSNTLILGSTAAAANNQIMLVREQPPSFGYQRLATQSIVYPDLGIFVASHGMPNFLAETGSGSRRYFILYYLKDREAFACRTRAGDSHAVEFAGPYPITPREYRLLEGFQRDSSRRQVEL